MYGKGCKFSLRNRWHFWSKIFLAFAVCGWPIHQMVTRRPSLEKCGWPCAFELLAFECWKHRYLSRICHVLLSQPILWSFRAWKKLGQRGESCSSTHHKAMIEKKKKKVAHAHTCRVSQLPFRQPSVASDQLENCLFFNLSILWEICGKL